MDPGQFFTATRTLIVAGKGGVGKTTVAATLAIAAARSGVDTLLLEIEGKPGLPSLLGVDAGARADGSATPVAVGADAASLRVAAIAADAALVAYLEDHGLRAFGRTLARLHVLDTLATSTPGLRDLIVLGRIKQLAADDPARLLVVDAPASGHALSFLRSARGLAATVDAGPIRRQADEVDAMLTDPVRTQVVLVTLPEETPVEELIATAFALEDEIGVSLGPAVVNGLSPHCGVPTRAPTDPGVEADLQRAAATAARWVDARCAAQRRRVERLGAELPLEQLHLPRLATTAIGRRHLDALASVALEGIAGLRFGPR